MKVSKSPRGLEQLEHPVYLRSNNGDNRVASQSSSIGEYPDSFERPGSSFLWIGRDHHLNREEVAELSKRLAAWVETGSLEIT